MDEQTFQILQSAIEESDSNIYENIPQIEMETGSTIDVVKESYSNPSAPNLTIPNGQVVGSSFSSQNRDIQQCMMKSVILFSSGMPNFISSASIWESITNHVISFKIAI